jgi:hypothetical protein
MAADLYFDAPGAGPNRDTSHPDFVSTCAADFYYDPADQLSPFGSDEGAAELATVEEWYRTRTGDSLGEATLQEWSDRLGRSPGDVLTILKIGDVSRFTAMCGLDAPAGPDDYDYSGDLALICRAFAQFKVTGAVEPLMRELAFPALNRLAFAAQHEPAWMDRLMLMSDHLHAA